MRLYSSGARSRIVPNQFGSLSSTVLDVEPLDRPSRPKKRLREKAIARITAPVRYGNLHNSSTIQGDQLLIECSNSEFNLMNGARRIGHGGLLFTQFWDKNKYQNYSMTIKSQKTNRLLDDSTWSIYVPDKISSSVEVALQNMKLRRPNYVQRRCVECFSSASHLLLLSETGSGKTVAFGVPLVSHLIRSKAKGHRQRAVILCVSSGLRDQIAEVISDLCVGSSLEVTVPKGEDDISKSKDWDILLGTPGLVAKQLESNTQDFRDSISQMVLDESDMLLDDSFANILTDIFALVRIRQSITNMEHKERGARILFTSASSSEEFENLLEGVVDKPFLSEIRSKHANRLVSQAEMEFIRMKERDKLERLEYLIHNDSKRGELNQTLVFCKDRKTTAFVCDWLKARGHTAAMWTARRAFAMSPPEAEITPEPRVFVATDVASRGVDLPNLSHVINYDMARNTVDFLHRAGRVSRLSSRFPGRVTSFVRTPEEVKTTNEIEAAVRLRRPLLDMIRTTSAQDYEDS